MRTFLAFLLTTLAFAVSAQTLPDGGSLVAVPSIGGGVYTGTVAAGPPPSTTTWDTVNKNANVVLSNGNLTASSGTATTANTSGRGSQTITTGQKIYGEFTATVNTGNSLIGVVNASFSFANFNYLGIDTNGIGLLPSGGVLYNNGIPASYSGFTTGDVISVAVDFNAGLMWWRINAGNWNNSGAANPATGVGGQTIGVTGNLFWAYGLIYDGATQNAFIGKFSSPFTFSVPAGFSGQP